ncbi:MAG: IclR family transcriptional regulator [Treponema sp.]|jgi:DNA-binding IclR family transcriptional regulator|nr:IclR family transcriptional regulator [Treponema sp.]
MRDDKYNIKAVMRCLKILDLAASADHPLGINEVCEALDININMAFRMLSSLVASGFMVKDERTGLYAVSLKALQLSRNALLSLDIRKLTMPYLELLWNQYPKANLNMAVYHEGEILVIDRIDSQDIPRTYFTPGKTVPFHCTGLGKILTCELPEAGLDALIAQKGLKSFTAKTITSPAALKKELAAVRADQLARDREEYILHDNCNAVPIRSSEGQIIAAISLTAFETYMSVEEIEAAIPALRNTAQRISYLAGFHDGMM